MAEVSLEDRVVLAPCKAALCGGCSVSILFIYVLLVICSSCSGLCRAYVQRVEGIHDACRWGNQKLPMDSRITTQESGCSPVGICMWLHQCESVYSSCA